MFSKINEALVRLVLRFKSEEGQALGEYGLILALVAIVCMVGLGILATALNGELTSIAGALGGGS